MKENPEDAKQGKEEETSFTQVALPKYFFNVLDNKI
jgi:hypothetical protein